MSRIPRTSEPIRLHLFGSPYVEQAGSIVTVRRRKSMALLAYLAVTGHPHSREALATLLWPEQEASTALGNLRRDLARARKDLGDRFDADRHHIALDSDSSLSVDVWEFEESLARVRQHAHFPAHPCAVCLEALTRAAQLYSEDFLAGFTLPDSPAWDEWQFFQSESLRAGLSETLQALIAWYTSQQEYAAAIPYARRWVALDPLNEPAQRSLMRLFAWNGQYATALRQYDEAARCLMAELGATPDEESQALVEAIRARQLAPPARTGEADRAAVVAQHERSGALPRRPFAPTDQLIRDTTSADGTRIAYAVVGSGPPLVKVANPLTDLQYDWESPVWRHWVEALSRDHRLIRYDERGCGLSQREVRDFSMDAWVSDLEAVVDDLDLQRFPIFGTSQGTSVAIAYAARHPERVSRLIFCGGYARGRFKRGSPPERLEGDMLLSLTRFGWGQDNPAFRRVFASLFVPGGTPEQHNWFTELARLTTEPETAAIMEEAFYNIDVTHLAPLLKMPTLVLHARDDQMVPFAEGQLLAELIPGARFIPLDSENHVLLHNEPAWADFLEATRAFLAEEPLPISGSPAE